MLSYIILHEVICCLFTVISGHAVDYSNIILWTVTNVFQQHRQAQRCSKNTNRSHHPMNHMIRLAFLPKLSGLGYTSKLRLGRSNPMISTFNNSSAQGRKDFLYTCAESLTSWNIQNLYGVIGHFLSRRCRQCHHRNIWI
jgi:hypothetical protein